MFIQTLQTPSNVLQLPALEHANHFHHATADALEYIGVTTLFVYPGARAVFRMARVLGIRERHSILLFHGNVHNTPLKVWALWSCEDG